MGESILRTINLTGADSVKTVYAGVEFKSKTESLWAAEFDRHVVPWRYEPQAHRMTLRSRARTIYGGHYSYRSDFKVGSGVIIEVKGWKDAPVDNCVFCAPQPMVLLMGRPDGDFRALVVVAKPAVARTRAWGYGADWLGALADIHASRVGAGAPWRSRPLALVDWGWEGRDG